MTMPINQAYTSNLVYSGEQEWTAMPIMYQTAAVMAPPLIYAHGYGGSAGLTLTPGNWAQYELLRELAEHFTVCAADLGFNVWGNDTHISRIGDAISYLGSLGATGPVTLVGASMGGCGVLNYANVWPANVRAVVGIIPVTDLNDMKANNRLGLASAVDAAYPAGSGYSNGVHGGHNPVLFAGSTLSPTIPIKLLYSGTDAGIVPSTQVAFKAARDTIAPADMTTITDIGTNGHSEQSIADAHPAAVEFARFLR